MTTRQPIRAEKPATAIHLGTGDTAYRRLAALDALAAHLGYTNLDGKAMRSRLFQAIADGDVALARSLPALRNVYHIACAGHDGQVEAQQVYVRRRLPEGSVEPPTGS